MNSWARGDHNSTNKLANALEIATHDEKTILKILQNMPLKDLFNNGVAKIRDVISALNGTYIIRHYFIFRILAPAF